MNPQVIQEIVKGGVAMVLAVGLMVILYQVVSHDKQDQQFLRDHMARQTAALEALVGIYSGGKYVAPAVP